MCISTRQRGDSRRTRWRMHWTDLTKLTRLWSIYSVTEQRWSTAPIEDTCHQIITCRGTRGKPRFPRGLRQTTTRSRTLRVSSWTGGERVDDDGYPLVDENSSTSVLVQRDRPLDEAEAGSLPAWAQGYQEVRKNLRDSFSGQKAKEHSTERLRGAELRKRTRCHRCQQLGHLARDCQHVPQDNHQEPAKSFFMPGGAFAQLHNLVSTGVHGCVRTSGG